jgi:GNAT superfamily N-acetyltransferase
MAGIDIRAIEGSELAAAFQVLHELREQLDYATFVSRLHRQAQHGYRLYGAFLGPSLVVAGDRRGQGIGVGLLEFAESQAREQGLSAVFLDSRQEAIGFYQKLSYTSHTAPLMRKGLQP